MILEGKTVKVTGKENFTGTFIAFGIGYEELYNAKGFSAGHYTEAIIMKKNGQLVNVPAFDVQVILES